MILISALLGLLVGSFLNALIHRLSTGESVLIGRSHCPNCKHMLAASDLIPLLSFMFLSGKCRYCAKPISWQYPLVETITSVLFALSFYYFWFDPVLLVYTWFVIAALIVVGTFDFKHFLILDKVVFPCLAVVTVFNLFWSLDSGVFLNIHSPLGSGVAGMVIVSGFFYLQYLISHGKWIGLGDVKLGLLLGSILGWKLGLMLLLVAYTIGAITGLVFLATNKKELGSKLPFGTFLAISAIINILWGETILDTYLKLIGFR
ncbi:MAG TPA: prepilin peptidase [Coxiellaceae bacterium]|nr:prepilin peptidase [Coxiellaceae bacterium]